MILINSFFDNKLKDSQTTKPFVNTNNEVEGPIPNLEHNKLKSLGSKFMIVILLLKISLTFSKIGCLILQGSQWEPTEFMMTRSKLTIELITWSFIKINLLEWHMLSNHNPCRKVLELKRTMQKTERNNPQLQWHEIQWQKLK